MALIPTCGHAFQVLSHFLLTCYLNLLTKHIAYVNIALAYVSVTCIYILFLIKGIWVPSV